jgi:hypothetical protein
MRHEAVRGCVDCNRWGHLGDKKLSMEMLEDDLQALRASVGEGIRGTSWFGK